MITPMGAVRAGIEHRGLAPGRHARRRIAIAKERADHGDLPFARLIVAMAFNDGPGEGRTRSSRRGHRVERGRAKRPAASGRAAELAWLREAPDMPVDGSRRVFPLSIRFRILSGLYAAFQFLR
jgi:hypothetical protein